MSNTSAEHFNHYMASDQAGRYKSFGHCSSGEGVDTALVNAAMQTLEQQGYVVFEKLIPRAVIDEIKSTASSLFEHEGGRNEFEGHQTRRLYSVIDKTFACNPLVDHPLIMALLDQLLMPNYLLSQLQVIDIKPGETQQPIHTDDAFYPVPRPRKPLGAATVWAIDDFTEDNGATMVIPASHLWGEQLPGDKDQQIPVVMPAGSVVFFLGTLWHGGGANRSAQSRMAVTAQYCEPWCRQQENFFLSVPKDRVAGCSSAIQSMLGYSIYGPFMGFVNGKHPKRLLPDQA